MRVKKISKFLSYVLRHNPDKLGIELDEQGWTDVEYLLKQIKASGGEMDMKLLEEVVETNDKKRFVFNENKTKIRANQGHSIIVDLNYDAITPPEYLYHGTVSKVVTEIQKHGLLKMSRHHVHLSEDRDTATKVGERRGKPKILVIRSGAMHRDKFQFYKSANNVWLTNHVPPEYIEF